MNKNILVLIILFCVIVFSCKNSAQQTEKQASNETTDQIHNEITDSVTQKLCEMITIEVENIQLISFPENEITSCVIKNNSGVDVHTGRHYRLERREFGGWQDVAAVKKMIFTDEEIIIGNGGNFTFEMHLYTLEPPLASGHYRIGKDIWFGNRERKCAVFGEFEIK